jgi:hypothetical protein
MLCSEEAHPFIEIAGQSMIRPEDDMDCPVTVPIIRSLLFFICQQHREGRVQNAPVTYGCLCCALKLVYLSGSMGLHGRYDRLQALSGSYAFL